MQTQITKKYNTEGGKISNTREIQHTLVDSRFFSSTACLKSEKIQKDKVQSVKEWKKYKKIQSAFLEVMEK